MCLAVPAKLVECDARIQRAVADLHGNRVRISTSLVPEAGVGDWVLVHAGFAIKKVDCDEATETFALIRDLAHHGGTDGLRAEQGGGGR
jgi:hydrogenase expression/formation protein HypC